MTIMETYGGRCLLQRALGGDRTAMAHLYRSEAAIIRAFLRRRDPRLSVADAEDLTQMVFLVLLRPRRRGRFRGDASPRTYLLAVARRLHLRHRRRRERRVTGPPDRLEHVAGPSADPVALLRGRELLDQLARASTRLPPGQRAAVLHALGAPVADPSELCSPAAMRRRLCDARQRLRRSLGNPPTEQRNSRAVPHTEP